MDERAQVGLVGARPRGHREPELAEEPREDRDREHHEHEAPAAGRLEEPALDHDEQQRDRGREAAEEERLDRVAADDRSPGTSRTRFGETGGVPSIAGAGRAAPLVVRSFIRRSFPPLRSSRGNETLCCSNTKSRRRSARAAQLLFHAARGG